MQISQQVDRYLADVIAFQNALQQFHFQVLLKWCCYQIGCIAGLDDAPDAHGKQVVAGWVFGDSDLVTIPGTVFELSSGRDIFVFLNVPVAGKQSEVYCGGELGFGIMVDLVHAQGEFAVKEGMQFTRNKQQAHLVLVDDQ